MARTPLGADPARSAANVQTVSGTDLESQRTLDLSEFMARNLASVFVNESQGNPLQPDLQYRGFIGSPLLGLAQGIAVFQDGIRLNEPFGDTVSWALIPEAAIDNALLMSGSNPLFGLNALGGAISIRTRDGFTSPGSFAELYAGSYGRRGVVVSSGGQTQGRFAHFLTANHFEEDGWRDFSPSRSTQLFGKASWDGDAGRADLSVAFAEASLTGNGPAPIELLETSRRTVYTRPDETRNRLGMIGFKGDRVLSASWTVTGNVYLRRSNIDSLNGDDSDYAACATLPALLCDADGLSVLADRTGGPIAAAAGLIGATVNRTATRQDSAGFGLQASRSAPLGGHANDFVVGASFETNAVDFSASSELGTLDATRLAVPGAVYVGDADIGLGTRSSNFGVYLTDTFALSAAVTLTLSGRYNDARIGLHDRLGTALGGEHAFSRFNPAVGITAAIREKLRFYASYGEANRAPSPVELTCADPGDPCRLPNAFLADPPLEQVVAGTVEFGFRGDRDAGQWHAGVFSTVNRDDILFISAGALTNQGYFDNVGKTRRDGVEVEITGQRGNRLGWFVNATVLNATFRSALVFPSANNPAATAGEVRVEPGDRLPLVPGRLLKAGLTRTAGRRLAIGFDLQAGSGFPMRGDEGNDVERIGDYVVVNGRIDARIGESLTVFGNVDNLLDRRYESFGLFGAPDDVLGDEYGDARFLSPAVPRTFRVGIRVEF